MQPIVSVVMPTYNAAQFIRSSIESVMAQNVPLELIIIDDCSLDGTVDIVNEYISSYGNEIIRYYRNEKNMGVAFSRNRGVSLSLGEYIAFLDSDDRWTSGKLHRQLELLKSNNMVLCSTARRIMTPNGQITDKVIPVLEHITYKQLLRQNLINCSSVLVRKDAIIKYPMEHEDSHEDYITWLGLLKEYKEACAINEPMLIYRLSNSGKSGKKLNSAKMTFKVYRYMGFGIFKSIYYFIFYAINGIIKYYIK